MNRYIQYLFGFILGLGIWGIIGTYIGKWKLQILYELWQIYLVVFGLFVAEVLRQAGLYLEYRKHKSDLK